MGKIAKGVKKINFTVLYGNYCYIIIENFPQKFSPCGHLKKRHVTGPGGNVGPGKLKQKIRKDYCSVSLPLSQVADLDIKKN